MSKRGSVFIIVGVLSALLSVAYAIFRRERQVLLDGLRRRRRLCLTEQGVVEYAIAGQGPAVLITHGTLGGYDQGLAFARPFDQHRFSFIAVSRAGYLGSGITTGLTPAEQADSYVALLDSLGLEKAAIIGVSDGSPSALQFASRYPERCSALVLMSAIGRRPPPPPTFFSAVLAMLLRFDFVWWPLYSFGPRLLLLYSGVSVAEVGPAVGDRRKRETLQAICRSVMTASLRRPGVLIDSMQLEELSVDHVAQISTPTLVAHSESDQMASFADARWLAQAIPEAELLALEDGGHFFFVIHSERVIPEITAFLETHTS